MYALWKYYKEKKIYWEYVGIFAGLFIGIPFLLAILFLVVKGMSPIGLFIVLLIMAFVGGYLANKGKKMRKGKTKKQHQGRHT